MGAGHTNPDRSEKFFFDLNNFDEETPAVDPAEEEREAAREQAFRDEIEATRKKSFENGRQQGLAEAAASREQAVAALLDNISGHFITLLNDENKRNARFESEAVDLCRVIFAKSFPALNKTCGLDEILAMIVKVMGTQEQQPEIRIETTPDYAQPLLEQLERIRENMPMGTTFTVNGNDSLGEGDCRLFWQEGGAWRDITGLSRQIEQHLEQILADKPRLLDNGGDESVQESENDASQETMIDDEAENGEEK
ncbi:MAG: hypothetical protein H6868_05210 [Rhodospirillales bacterium]|nr:hypothetical protein [Rhodospirillales bacterium]